MPENQERGEDRSDISALPNQISGERPQTRTDAEQTAQIKNLSRKVVWTWVVAAFGPLLALAGLFFASLQWQVADGQLRVMEAQLKDARDGAAQARRDTDSVIAATKSQAESLKALVGSNKRQLAIAEAQASSLRKQAESMTSQAADAGPVEFLLIKSDGSITPRDIENANMGDEPTIGVAVPIGLLLTNTGRSVANNIRVTFSIALLSPKSFALAAELDTMATVRCDWAGKHTQVGKTLFPGDKVMQYGGDFEPIPPENIVPPSVFSGRRGKSVEMVLVGCAVYAFSNSPALHRTWFAYRIGRRTTPQRRPFDTWYFEIAKTVPSQDVFFEKWPHGGNGAD